jgi:hypothetical protein
LLNFWNNNNSGLIVGLHSRTHSKLAVIDGILTKEKNLEGSF